MSRITRTPASRSGSVEAPIGVDQAQPRLISLLAQSTRASDMLPHLHQYALEATGGDCALLFRHNPRNGRLHATSGFRLDALGSEPWAPDAEEAALIASAFDTAAPVFVADADRLMPELSARLA